MKRIEDLFFVDVFQEAKVIAGHKGLHRKVESIEISETPDVIHFLAENSLLITTGYAFKDNPIEIGNLISEINERPCAGIAIKLKRFIDEIPPEVIDLANSLDFPIIQIPVSLTLGTVAHQLLSFIWDSQTQELNYAIHVHKKFTNMMIKGYKLEAMIESLGALLKSPVLLLDTMGEATSFSHHFEKDNMKKTAEIVKEYINRDIDSYREQEAASIIIPGVNISVKIFHVKTMHPYPYLLVIFHPEELPYPFSQLAIEQASTVISFTMLKNEAIRENSRLLENNFFTSLVDGNLPSKQEIILRGKQHGLIDNLNYVCIVCKIDDVKQSADRMNILYDYFYNYLNNSFFYMETKNIIFIKDDYFVILLQTSLNMEDPIKSTIDEKLLEFQQKVNTNLKISLSFGVGNVFNDVAYIPITFSEAVDAWKQGAEMFHRKFINFFVPKKLIELLRLIPEDSLLSFYENTLHTLSYPKNKDEEDLVNTLIVYMDNNCEIALTSRKLYVHRNTVKYRIAKCEELLGCSVHDSQSSLHLRLALLMRSIFIKKP